MTINLEHAPASLEKVAEMRIACKEAIAKTDSKERANRKLLDIIKVGGLLTLGFLWPFGFIGDEIVISIVAGVIMAIVLFLAPSGVTVISAGLLAFILFNAGNPPGSANYTAIIYISVTCVVLVGIYTDCLYHDKYIYKPRKRSRKRLGELVELEHSKDHEKCIQFIEWCENDDVLRNYQHQLAEMGRKPTRGEYMAAKKWMAGRKQRLAQKERIEQAKIACNAMAEPV